MKEAGNKTDKTNSIGVVETQFYTYAESGNEHKLESGEKLGPITLAYETYGTLNADKSNAILALHALSGDAHAAGVHRDEDNAGWWDEMIGPGKAFDTNRYFIICSNVLGGCKGSTGPSSIKPTTGKPYALDRRGAKANDPVLQVDDAPAPLESRPILGKDGTVDGAVVWSALLDLNQHPVARARSGRADRLW